MDAWLCSYQREQFIQYDEYFCLLKTLYLTPKLLLSVFIVTVLTFSHRGLRLRIWVAVLPVGITSLDWYMCQSVQKTPGNHSEHLIGGPYKKEDSAEFSPKIIGKFEVWSNNCWAEKITYQAQTQIWELDFEVRKLYKGIWEFNLNFEF